MRIVVLGAGVLLAGCVQQQPYMAPPGPIELQTYPPYSYRTSPVYRAPEDAPLAQPLPPPIPLTDPASSGSPAPSDETGPIPLQQMPPPAPDAPAASPAQTGTTTQPQTASPAPVAARPPTVGPGSNVPLEGFRPMRGQTRPAP